MSPSTEHGAESIDSLPDPTHDVTTMTRHALDRIARGQAMPGVIAVHQRLPIGSVVDDLVLVASSSFPEDWVNQIRFSAASIVKPRSPQSPGRGVRTAACVLRSTAAG